MNRAVSVIGKRIAALRRIGAPKSEKAKPNNAALRQNRAPPRGENVELIPLAAHDDGFVLFERKNGSTAAWLSLKLQRRPRQAGKNNWWFGWDGTRVSRTTDAGKLAKHHPEILQWVIDVLRANIGA